MQLKLVMFLTLSVVFLSNATSQAQGKTVQNQANQSQVNQAPANQAQGDVYLVYMLGIT